MFYPSIGLCSVEKTEERNGKTYIVLTSTAQDFTVLLPMENASSLGLRHLSNRDSLISSIRSLSLVNRDEEAQWKHRVEKNAERMKEGKPESICLVISSLYRRSRKRDLPTVEKKQYDRALAMLVDEASCVLKKEREEVRKIIFSYLKKGDTL